MERRASPPGLTFVYESRKNSPVPSVIPQWPLW
jgi:hypothetical protein